MIRLAVRCRPEQAELRPRRAGRARARRRRGGARETATSSTRSTARPASSPSSPTCEAAAGDGLVEIETTEIPDDWADRWRDFHEPVVVGDGRLVVRPSWEDGGAGARGRRRGRSRAAPSGPARTRRRAAASSCCSSSPTTASPRGRSPIWGTGSGVLAIAAAKLGWEPGRGCDHETRRRRGRDRQRRARTAPCVAVERLNLREEAPPAAPTVVANLTAPLLVPLAERMAAGEIAVPERMVAQRPAADRARPRRGRVRRRGPRPSTTAIESGDWAALLLRTLSRIRSDAPR